MSDAKWFLNISTLFMILNLPLYVVGVGEAASITIKEITNSLYLDGKVVCAIDDNKSKRGSYIQGVKIVGSRYNIVAMAEKYKISHIIIAIPSPP